MQLGYFESGDEYCKMLAVKEYSCVYLPYKMHKFISSNAV